jgi:hypothetical protein
MIESLHTKLNLIEYRDVLAQISLGYHPNELFDEDEYKLIHSFCKGRQTPSLRNMQDFFDLLLSIIPDFHKEYKDYILFLIKINFNNRFMYASEYEDNLHYVLNLTNTGFRDEFRTRS